MGDYARSRMTLEPNQHLRDRFPTGGPSVSLRNVPADGTVKVREVPAQSPAARAGLVAGDVITAVDGTPVADLAFTRMRALIARPGKYALTVRRAGRSLTVVLDNPPQGAAPIAADPRRP